MLTPDPTYTTLAHEQDETWTFEKLVALFVASLIIPLFVIYVAAKLVAG
jgi:hypothetical protein